MKLTYLAILIALSSTTHAGEVATFKNPKIDVHSIAADSDLDSVCRSLVNENSAYVRHSLHKSGNYRLRHGCGTIAHSYVYQFDQHNDRVEKSIYHVRGGWITQIGCWK